MAELFGKDVRTLNEHLQNLFEEGELEAEATIRKFRIVRTEGSREVTRLIDHYNREAILAVGYRVRSPRGTQFRRWATERLAEYLLKGFTMDDERLKNPPVPGAGVPDYFDEVLERIRDIRASEKRMYLQVRAYIFVAVLGASYYTYAEATWTRSLPDWIGSHTRMFEYFDGATQFVVPDQWKAGVNKPCYWEPELNRTYKDWATHYGVAVVPARPGHTRDKAKIEAGVLIVQRWILAALRKRRFFSLGELNEAIRELLARLNQRPFRKLPGTRRELFEQLDRPALHALPAQRFVFAEWKKTRAGLDYHVELEGHFYSVPYQLAQQVVELRYTAATVEVLYRGKRVASHARSHQRTGNTTEPCHQPKSHQRYREWTPQRLLEWASAVGVFTWRLVEAMLTHKPHPEAGFRAAMGPRSLASQYGSPRLEAAAERAVRFKLYHLDNCR